MHLLRRLRADVGEPSAERALEHGVRASGIRLQPNAAQLSELSRLIDAGTVKTILAKVFPLSATREAHEASQTGHTRGKIVLQVVA